MGCHTSTLALGDESEAAERSYGEACQIRQQLAEKFSESADLQSQYGGSLNDLAYFLRKQATSYSTQLA